MLALLRPQRSPLVELVQSRVISEENLARLLDRSDLLAPAPPSHTHPPSAPAGKEEAERGAEPRPPALPASGPGWEVVQAGAQAEMLASIG